MYLYIHRIAAHQSPTAREEPHTPMWALCPPAIRFGLVVPLVAMMPPALIHVDTLSSLGRLPQACGSPCGPVSPMGSVGPVRSRRPGGPCFFTWAT